MYVVANQRLAFKNKLADDEIHSKRNLCQKIGGWQNLIEASFCEFNFINLNKIEIGCKPFGVHIEYYFEKEPLGNAGALFKIKDKLGSDFLLLNADAVFDVDFNRFVAFHKQHGGVVTLFTHPNSHAGRVKRDERYLK